MKTLYILFVIIAISNNFSSNTFAQGLTQDSKGKSSIIYPGVNLGLNVQEGAIDFNYTLFSKKIFPDAIGKGEWIFGVNLKGKNNEGISNLFTDGNFTPLTSGRIIFGYTFKEGNKKYTDDSKTKRYQQLLNDEVLVSKKNRKQHTRTRKKLLSIFSNKFNKMIDNLTNKDSTLTTFDNSLSRIPQKLKNIISSKIEKVLKGDISENINQRIGRRV
ncbi:MAG: hypothetical protein U5N85_10825 [Arcicella sp.]|nr:hypothetical protein [Arcicella sp.]